MTDQPERLSTDELPPGCPAWAGALFGELALKSDLTSYRVVEVLGLLEATRSLSEDSFLETKTATQ